MIRIGFKLNSAQKFRSGELRTYIDDIMAEENEVTTEAVGHYVGMYGFIAKPSEFFWDRAAFGLQLLKDKERKQDPRGSRWASLGVSLLNTREIGGPLPNPNVVVDAMCTTNCIF